MPLQIMSKTIQGEIYPVLLTSVGYKYPVWNLGVYLIRLATLGGLYFSLFVKPIFGCAYTPLIACEME